MFETDIAPTEVVNVVPSESELQAMVGLAVATGILILILTICTIAAAILLTGLIFYYYRLRPENWIKITRTMHQRLSRQVLQEEYLKKFCEIIKASVDIVHLDRKEISPNAENDLDLPPMRTVDPFKAPSNMYDQVAEKDDDYKTMRHIDNDVFLKKDDLEMLKPNSRMNQKAPADVGTPQPSQKKDPTPSAVTAPGASTAIGGNATPTPTPIDKEGAAGTAVGPTPLEKPPENPEKCDKPGEEKRSMQLGM